MGNLRRYHEDNRPYFVTTVVKERRPIFADHYTASLLQEVFDTCRRRYRFLLLSHVIMPDHVHAIIVPGVGDNISAVMRYIKGTFGRAYNARCGTTGAVWQPRFHDVAVRSERELMTRIRYAETNPVQAGLVAEPQEYLFSSAHPDWRSDLQEYLGAGGPAEGT